MRPIAFIAVLFMMAAACVVIAAADQSWAWLLGAAAFFALGSYALRQRKLEQDPDYQPGSGVGRLVFVLVILGGGIYGIYWLATAN